MQNKLLYIRKHAGIELEVQLFAVRRCQTNTMQNILFCAYNYHFLHNAYTLSSYMAQPYILMLILKIHNMSSKL